MIVALEEAKRRLVAMEDVLHGNQSSLCFFKSNYHLSIYLSHLGILSHFTVYCTTKFKNCK